MNSPASASLLNRLVSRFGLTPSPTGTQPMPAAMTERSGPRRRSRRDREAEGPGVPDMGVVLEVKVLPKGGRSDRSKPQSVAP